MLGGVFPLVTEQMFRAMTYPGASSFLGGVVSNSEDFLQQIMTCELGGAAHCCTLGLGRLRTKDPSQKQIRQCMYHNCSYYVEEHRSCLLT